MDLSSFITIIITGIVGPLLPAWLRKIAPFKPLNAKEYTYEMLDKRFSHLEKYYYISYILLATLITLVLTGIFNYIANVQMAKLQSFKYFITPDILFWFIPAFFLSLFISSLLLELLIKILFKQIYLELSLYHSLKFGYDSQKLLKPIVMIVFYVVLLLLLFGYNDHIRVTDNEFIIHSFFSLREKKYSFSQIKTIKNITSQEAKEKKLGFSNYEIDFNDGYKWNTIESFGDPNYKENMVLFIADKERLKIQ